MMNGNVTKAGITRDFEELAKAGVGGVQMFDAGCAVPPGDGAPGERICVSSQWHVWHE